MDGNELEMSKRPAATLLAVLALVIVTACGPPAVDSVVLIVADTLRADHLGLYGYDRDTSAALDRWSREGLVFENAYSTSPWTLPAFGSIYTGQLPSRHRAGFITTGAQGEESPLDPTIPTLPGLLLRRQFATAAFVTNPYLQPSLGLARGFGHYSEGFGESFDFHMPEYRRADATADLALEWLAANTDSRFFLVVHFFDPHAPNSAPPPFRGRFTADYDGQLQLPVTYAVDGMGPLLSAADRSFVVAAYDEEISFVDRQVGRLLQGLKEEGVWEQSLVVFTADHGEELFERGRFDHGHTLHDELLRVPLVMWGPRVQPGRTAVPASLADVGPTVLEAIGVDDAPDTVGLSLWSHAVARTPLPARRILAQGTYDVPQALAVVDPPLKWIVYPEGQSIQLFDLAADPGETADLSGTVEARGDQWIQELLARLDTGEAVDEADLVKLEPEALRILRSLGYVR